VWTFLVVVLFAYYWTASPLGGHAQVDLSWRIIVEFGKPFEVLAAKTRRCQHLRADKRQELQKAGRKRSNE